MSLLIAKRKAPHCLHILPDMKRYHIESQNIYSHLLQYSPIVIQASIDEFYIDLSGCERLYGNLIAFSWTIKKKLERLMELPCTIGAGHTKRAAKMACLLAKPSGMLVVTKQNESLFFGPLPIRFVPGIGKKTHQQLKERHVHTIRDWEAYTQTPLQWTPQTIPADSVHTSSHKQISSDTTFETDLTDMRRMFSTLSKHCQVIGFKLRRHAQYACCIGIKIKYADFKCHSKRRMIVDCQYDHDLYQYAKELFEQAYTRRTGIRCLGVFVTQLNTQSTLPLFAEQRNASLLYTSIDKNRHRYGFNCIQIAQSIDPRSS